MDPAFAQPIYALLALCPVVLVALHFVHRRAGEQAYRLIVRAVSLFFWVLLLALSFLVSTAMSTQVLRQAFGAEPATWPMLPTARTNHLCLADLFAIAIQLSAYAVAHGAARYGLVLVSLVRHGAANPAERTKKDHMDAAVAVTKFGLYSGLLLAMLLLWECPIAAARIRELLEPSYDMAAALLGTGSESAYDGSWFLGAIKVVYLALVAVPSYGFAAAWAGCRHEIERPDAAPAPPAEPQPHGPEPEAIDTGGPEADTGPIDPPDRADADDDAVQQILDELEVANQRIRDVEDDNAWLRDTLNSDPTSLVNRQPPAGDDGGDDGTTTDEEDDDDEYSDDTQV